MQSKPSQPISAQRLRTGCHLPQTGNSTKTLGLLSRLSKPLHQPRWPRVFDSLSDFGAVAMAIIDQKSPQLLQPSWKRWITPGISIHTPRSHRAGGTLTEMAPGELNHALFTNSGSECADTSLKLPELIGAARVNQPRRVLSLATRVITGSISPEPA